jgi:hypothetical protein
VVTNDSCGLQTMCEKIQKAVKLGGPDGGESPTQQSLEVGEPLEKEEHSHE